ncbi:MAG TPA: PadR family transcriptional regulator [Opitutaceae bacterium]|nr:PadR family transcriptional regulator [Opitutaceae bacterium]
MDKIDLLQGNLEMMILRVLSGGAQHGWGIAQRIHVLSSEALKIEEGSLYLALYRMQRKGWIKAEWDLSDNNRRARYWELTKAGRQRLEAQTSAWDRLCAAIASVMKAEQTPAD